MSDYVDFQEVMDLADAYGAKLQRIWEPYRVFTMKDRPLPFLIPVHHRKVHREYLERFQKWLEGQEI